MEKLRLRVQRCDSSRATQPTTGKQWGKGILLGPSLMLFPPQEAPFMPKHNLRRKTLISHHPWSAWTQGRGWYPRCQRKVSDVGCLKVQTLTAPHRSEGRDGKWAASITRKQPASGARRDQESPWNEGPCLRTQESRAKEK